MCDNARKLELPAYAEPKESYAMKRHFLFAILLSALLLTACSAASAPADSNADVGQPISVAGGSYTDVSVPELRTMLDEKDFVFVNVHIPFEGDLPNTDTSIPFDEIAQNLGQLPTEKDAKIVLYCRSGNMSSQAANTLVELGYTNIWNLAGGFNAWKAAGLPMAGE
jgi:phage shock protein E